MGESDVKQREIKLRGAHEEIERTLRSWGEPIQRYSVRNVFPGTVLTIRLGAWNAPYIDGRVDWTRTGAIITGTGTTADWNAAGELWDELIEHLQRGDWIDKSAFYESEKKRILAECPQPEDPGGWDAVFDYYYENKWAFDNLVKNIADCVGRSEDTVYNNHSPYMASREQE